MVQLPAYIGGFRSGTTLLINLVGLHPALVPWFETKELCELLRWLRVTANPAESSFESAYCAPAEPPGFALESVYSRMLWQMRNTWHRIEGGLSSGKATHEHYPIGHDYVLYSLKEAEALVATWRLACEQAPTRAAILQASTALISALSTAQCSANPAASWVNKTPEISRFAAELRTLSGPTRIIYMVRNGLEVVASASELGWGSGRDLAYNWQGLLQRTRQAMHGHESHYLELRYEQLLSAPENLLDSVFAFLGVAQCGADIVQQFRKRYGSDAFTPGRGSSLILPQETLRQFLAVAGDTQAALGYPVPVI